jgi:hypothetical protein
MRLQYVQSWKNREPRDGVAATELACLLPLLIFCSMAVVDFARVTYVQVALQTCARNGALYEFYSQAGLALPSGWTSLSSAASSDAPSGITVAATATSPAAASNNYVTVTVTTTFKLIALPALDQLPTLPGTISLSQSATMPFPASASAVP